MKYISYLQNCTNNVSSAFSIDLQSLIDSECKVLLLERIICFIKLLYLSIYLFIYKHTPNKDKTVPKFPKFGNTKNREKLIDRQIDMHLNSNMPCTSLAKDILKMQSVYIMNSCQLPTCKTIKWVSAFLAHSNINKIVHVYSITFSNNLRKRSLEKNIHID